MFHDVWLKKWAEDVGLICFHGFVVDPLHQNVIKPWKLPRWLVKCLEVNLNKSSGEECWKDNGFRHRKNKHIILFMEKSHTTTRNV